MPRFTPKPRKQKARRQAAAVAEATAHAASTVTVAADANVQIIVPGNKHDLEARKRQLREDIRREQATRPSAKKAKRLDKYIENKLKKDENLEILRLLEKEKERDDERRQQEGLGAKRRFEDVVESRQRERMERKRRKFVHEVVDEREESDSSDDDDEEEEKGDSVMVRPVNGEGARAVVSVPAAPIGGGLAQPLKLDADGLPIIAVKQGRKKRRKLAQEHTSPTQTGDGAENEEWNGFSDQEGGHEQTELEDKAKRMEIIKRILAQEEDMTDSDEGSAESEEGENQDDSDQSDDTGSSGGEQPEEDCDDESDVGEQTDTDIKPRISAFKDWATQQLNHAFGHVPSYESGNLPTQTAAAQPQPVPQKPVINPVLQILQKPDAPVRKAYPVHVQRSEELQASRSKLPILQREQEIMEAINNNPVIIIKGDTGSGKTTQIPQFLYESGFGSPGGPMPGMIGITQPRRVAAVSMAKRVGDEMGDSGNKVAYQIRFDSNVSPKTAVKFMTDGILLRELSQDLLLRKYSVIVIDEAHERSVNTDILIGILSKVVPARLRKTKWNPDPKPLKLIIMSATLNISDFLNDRLFEAGSKPPIVDVEGRQHRVTTHFALRSRADYLDEVVEKVRRAHRKLPRGGMLVFLTGQNEIREVSQRLRQMLGRSDAANGSNTKVQLASAEVPLEVEDMEIETLKQVEDERDDFDDVEFVTGSEEEDDEFDISDDEEEQTTSLPVTTQSSAASKDPYTDVHILPLYSQLPTVQQLRVFEAPPANARLIVLATNVAETSLTIPGIRYVFDTGRSKERKYNLSSGVQSFEIDWISKASSAQRAGRAGRTGPGHCWRLYTSAVYEQFFPEHATPEILRTPAESIVPQLKGFEYPKPIVQFPFPSTPDTDTLTKAENLLKNLGALTAQGKITDLGKELSVYPLSPRLGKIMSRGVQDAALLNHAISCVAGLAVQEIFYNEAQLGLSGEEEEDARDQRKQAFGRARATLSKTDKLSDTAKLLTAVTMYTAASDKDDCCRELFLRPKAMFEVAQLQRQLQSIVRANNPSLLQTSSAKISSKQSRQLNAIAASGYIDQVAIRADLAPHPPEMPPHLRKPHRAIDMPYLPLIPLRDGRPSASILEKIVFIHPSSVLAKHSPKDLPQYIVYSHLQKAQAQNISTNGSNDEANVPKTRMFPLTPVDGRTLVDLARDTALLQFGKPVLKMKVTELSGTPRRRKCWVTTELRGSGAGGYGWPLPAVHVRQIIDTKAPSGWRVEEVLDS